jgi:hypothetical protein
MDENPGFGVVGRFEVFGTGECPVIRGKMGPCPGPVKKASKRHELSLAAAIVGEATDETQP